MNNIALLDRAVEIRREIAALLGYDSWADYVTELKMVKRGANVVEVYPIVLFAKVGC